MKKLLYDFTDKDLRIFREELENFLPEKIIDTHVHIWKKEDRIKNAELHLYNGPGNDDSYTEYTYEDFNLSTKRLFPSKKYAALFLGIPVSWMDYSKNNKYLSEVFKSNNVCGCYITKNDQKEIPEDFFRKRFVGFKPYPDLIIGNDAKDYLHIDINVNMYSYMSEAVLEFANKHKLMIVNHIPRAKRLNDENNIKEIIDITSRYPDIKMILAHAGRSYTYYDIKDSIEYIKGIENLYFDLAMVQDIRVIETLIKKVGPGRILYASDLPVPALKGKNVDINNKHYFITKDYKTWTVSSTEMDLSNFTFFIYEIVRSIKNAVEITGLNREGVEKIFYRNALELINDVKKYNDIL